MKLKPNTALILIVAVYLLNHVAQIAMTPLGEGMDFFGHLAYIVFYAEEGRPPTPGELSMPSWIVHLEQLIPAPDSSGNGQKYRAWANLTPMERIERRKAALVVPYETQYVAPNYQTQHPPLYYWLMSLLYRLLSRSLDLEQRVYLLSVASVCLAALGLPAIYLMFQLYLNDRASLLGLLAVAWYPNLLVFLGRVTNDTLAFPLISWGIFLCCHARRHRSMRSLTAAGVLLVLASFTKTYALTLLPLYLLCALWGEDGAPSWRNLGVALAISLTGAGGLLWFNFHTTGHLIPLIQMRLTDAVPLIERIWVVTKLDPVWFFGGLIKGFWWSGYWSFVSPGVFYYIPMLFSAYLLLKRPLEAIEESRFFSIRLLWPHYFAIAFFVVGMIWHAATFKLYADLVGETIHSGNEGWYANVLLGSVFIIGLVLLKSRLYLLLFERVVASIAIFFILWDIIARIALIAYWSGIAEVEGRLRGIRWEMTLNTTTPLSSVWDVWQTIPGIMNPVLLTFVLPLMIAVISSVVIIVAMPPTDELQLSRGDFETVRD